MKWGEQRNQAKKANQFVKLTFFLLLEGCRKEKSGDFSHFQASEGNDRGVKEKKEGHPRDGEKKGFQRLNGKFDEVRCCFRIHSRQPVTILDYPLIWSRKFHSNSATRHHQIVWTSSSKKDKNRTECRQRNSSSSSSILRGKNLIEQSSRPARKKRGLAMLKWEIWICADPMFIMAMDP